ncbi:MAG: MFS transporter, partial [Natronospirillum sp.]
LAPLGGLVAEYLGWRAVFLVKLPLLALVLWLGYQILPLAQGMTTLKQRLPVPDRSMLWETLLIGGAVTVLLLAFEVVEQWPWLAVLLVVLSVLTMGWWSRLQASTVLLTLVGNRHFGLPALALMLIAALIGLISFTLPFFVADVMGMGAEVLSIAVVGFVVAAAVVSPLAGIMADRYGAINVATAGAGLTILGLLSVLSLDANATVLELTLCTAATGLGMAFFNAPVMAALMAAANPAMMGAASGISSVARFLGSTFGPAVAALAWNINQGGVAGLHASVWALAGMATVGFLALLWARR